MRKTLGKGKNTKLYNKHQQHLRKRFQITQSHLKTTTNKAKPTFLLSSKILTDTFYTIQNWPGN